MDEFKYVKEYIEKRKIKVLYDVTDREVIYPKYKIRIIAVYKDTCYKQIKLIYHAKDQTYEIHRSEVVSESRSHSYHHANWYKNEKYVLKEFKRLYDGWL